MPKDTEIKLPSLDELFTTQEERDDAKLKKIYEIPLNEIDPFPDHPFKVRDDEDIQGRELMTPDEVRMLDNQYALLFIRGERPVKDLKYNILKHPLVVLTADGKTSAYKHGEADKAKNTITLSPEVLPPFDNGSTDSDYLLLSEEDLENMFKEEEKTQNNGGKQ